MRLAALVVILILLPSSPRADARCSVSAAPKLSLAPLRYLRVRATVEVDPTVGRIEAALVGPDGFVTSTLLWQRGWIEAPRSFQFEWKNLGEDVGEYDVVLQAGNCRARDHIIVS